VNGDFQFFLPDSQGSVRDVVDENGDVIQSYEFNEHGLPMPGSGAGSGTFSPKTYQGGLSVNDDRNDSGLYLMGHRHYASELGRFISRDPIGFRGSLNLFATHAVNPVTVVDPNGLNPGLVVSAGAYAVTEAALYLNDAKKYAQEKARDLINRSLKDRIYAGPPENKPRDGSYKCDVLYDKFKHCVVSCQTALKFGGATAWAIGFGHEARAVFSKTGFDSRDIAANVTGIGFADWVTSDADCERACASKYQKSYTWCGDKTVLPTESIIPADRPSLKVPPAPIRLPGSRGEQF
jgi:RHS repeat-associated protein